jgi:hypothetical protein
LSTKKFDLFQCARDNILFIEFFHVAAAAVFRGEERDGMEEFMFSVFMEMENLCFMWK